MNNNLTQTRWADHLRACAVLTNDIAYILNIHDDSARQACFATVAIDASKHNIFLEPIPEAAPYKNESAPGAPVPSSYRTFTDPPVVSMWAIPSTGTDGRPPGFPDDPHRLPQRQEPPKGEVVGENLGAIRDPTPEQAEAASRGALLKGINSARELLGFTPKKLNEYIQEKLKVNKTLGTLDVDELADLTERLSKRIDMQKKNDEALEDWP